MKLGTGVPVIMFSWTPFHHEICNFFWLLSWCKLHKFSGSIPEENVPGCLIGKAALQLNMLKHQLFLT